MHLKTFLLLSSNTYDTCETLSLVFHQNFLHYLKHIHSTGSREARQSFSLLFNTQKEDLTQKKAIRTVRPPEGQGVWRNSTRSIAAAWRQPPLRAGLLVIHEYLIPGQSLPETVQFLRPPGNWIVPGAFFEYGSDLRKR